MSPQIIDVDEPIRIDLTQDILIDLTDEIEFGASPEKPQLLPESTNVYMHPAIPHAPRPQKHARQGDVQLPEPEPPAKRRRTATPTTYKTPSTVRCRVQDVIELDSDDEDLRLRNSRSGEDEDEYDSIHAGYDLKNPGIWKPFKVNRLREQFRLRDSKILGSDVTPPPKDQHIYAEYVCMMKEMNLDDDAAPWEIAKPLQRVGRRLPLPQASLPTQRIVPHAAFRPFHPVTSFKSAPGSINRVVQSHSWVGICSAATGGQPDEPGETLNVYNREGAVMVWNDKLETLPAHVQRRNGYFKQYSVNDIKFDPTGSLLVTTGNDKSLRCWRYDHTRGAYTSWWDRKFKHVPHDIAFDSGGTRLAVAERKLVLYSRVLDDDGDEEYMSIVERNKKHSIGPMAWGRGGTADYIYASTEPDNEQDLTGFHKAFDATAVKVAYEFDAQGAGDAIAVTNDGERLAIFTRPPDRTHSLRIYDIRNRNPNSMMSLSLSPYPSNINGEVNCASFSPDGIYLALGRNDNCIHIYDSRMLDRVVFDYEHFGLSRTSPGNPAFGVLQIEWVDGSSRHLPAGLVTCGNDGCVRFWDPFRSAKSSRNGTILAECNSDLAYFSLGDPFKGERGLVVGDCSGEVAVFDIGRSNLL